MRNSILRTLSEQRITSRINMRIEHETRQKFKKSAVIPSVITRHILMCDLYICSQSGMWKDWPGCRQRASNPWRNMEAPTTHLPQSSCFLLVPFVLSLSPSLSNIPQKDKFLFYLSRIAWYIIYTFILRCKTCQRSFTSIFSYQNVRTNRALCTCATSSWGISSANEDHSAPLCAHRTRSWGISSPTARC